MTPDRWNKIDHIFDVAMELPTERRASYLDEICAGDKELRAEVESLLIAHEKSGTFIETTPAKGVAAAFSQQFSPEALIGRTLGHYRIEALLGAGGMGEVYRARDLKLDRNVAVKVLPQHLSSNPEALARFEREAKAIAALPHPNILAIHDFGHEGGVTYAVMELLEGETLRQRIARSMEIPTASTASPSMAGINWREAVKIAAAVAEGLAAAHARGIIHRDIKPENVFLTADGVVKVLDFGIARVKKEVVSNAETLISQGIGDTKPGTLMGTIGYMSPEQVRGHNADAPSDIFSMGCVLVEMLTGERPFARNNAAETMASILRDDPPTLESASQEIPSDLEIMIQRCLAKTPEDRYQSARDLAFDLRSLLTSSSGAYRPLSGEHRRVTAEVQAIPTGSTKTPWTKIRPAWLIFGLFLLLLTIALGSTLYFWWGTKPAKDPISTSLAVLPLVNESDDKDVDFLSAGLADNIIANLSPLRPKLRVMASSSVSAYKGKAIDPRQVGRDLNVRAVLVGKVSQKDNLLVIEVVLVDATDGTEIWAERYRQQSTDLMSIQENISRQIAEKLQLDLTGEERQLLTKRYTSNKEAYSHYLTGRYFWNQRTDDSYKKAIKFYQQAIELDSNYALAYAGMADAYALMFDGGPRRDAAREQAQQFAHKAMSLDPQMAEPLATLGFIEIFKNHNWTEAEKNFKRSLQLNRGYATTHHWYALLLTIQGRFDAALEEFNRAKEIDPRSFPINKDIGEFLFHARRYDEAIAQFRHTIEAEPTNQNVAEAYSWIKSSYERKGDLLSAINEMKHTKASAEQVTEIRRAFDQGGASGYWQKRLELRLQNTPATTPDGRMLQVYAYAAAGNADLAMKLLDKSVNEDRHDGTLYLKVDPRFDNLRSHPHFPELLWRMKLLN